MIFQSHTVLKRHIELYCKGAPIILTNGCFDILHVGHVKTLKACSGHGLSLNGLGQWAKAIVVVAVDSDESVAKLKGDHRPIHSFADRATIINTLKPVDYVVRMSSEDFKDLVEALQPSIYVKGSEYKNSLNPSDVISLEGIGCKIKFCEMVSDRSTTKSIKKINHMISEL